MTVMGRFSRNSFILEKCYKESLIKFHDIPTGGRYWPLSEGRRFHIQLSFLLHT